MRVLADENIPKAIWRLMKNHSWDVKCVDTRNKGISDEQVIQMAIHEKRVLVSSDKLLCKRLKGAEHSGVLFINTGHQHQIEAMTKFLQKYTRPTIDDDVVITLTKDDYTIWEHKKKYIPPKNRKISLN